jgi:hypothetical protein
MVGLQGFKNVKGIFSTFWRDIKRQKYFLLIYAGCWSIRKSFVIGGGNISYTTMEVLYTLLQRWVTSRQRPLPLSIMYIYLGRFIWHVKYDRRRHYRKAWLVDYRKRRYIIRRKIYFLELLSRRHLFYRFVCMRWSHVT